MKKSNLIGGVALSLVLGSCSGCKEEKPANILFIIADQLSWQAIETYGDTTGSTPTVDSLGRNGVAFSQAYTACPLSMPARAALWTGQYPHTTKVESNGRNWPVDDVAESMPTMGSIFTANGYDCVHFGKQHDSGSLRGFRLEPYNYTEIPNEYEAYPLTKDTYFDVYATNKAVDYIKSTKDNEKPFFCVVDLNNPHNICEYIGKYKGVTATPDFLKSEIELPANFVDEFIAERPHPIQYLCCSHVRQSQTSSWDAEDYKNYLVAYHYYANRMDKDVNSVMQALRESGNADNTLIVFISDHGEGMAAKRMVTKQGTPYDQTTRIPAIFAGKGVNPQKSTIDAPLVNVSIDMLPTLCDFANIELSGEFPGKSMLGWIQGKDVEDNREYICTEWLTEWGYTVSPFRMIRSQDYKYVKYLENDAEELFDINNDPLEMNNLSADPEFATVLEQHRAYLAEHISSTNDTFYTREVRWDHRAAQHELGYENHEGPAVPQMKKN